MEHEVYCEISEKLSDKCTCRPGLVDALEMIVSLAYGSYADAIAYAEGVLSHERSMEARESSNVSVIAESPSVLNPGLQPAASSKFGVKK